ncbi:hypothetical protein Esti_006089 [Eimeria stiedai]
MSSLAAARADGFYYPPAFDPETHGSLNRFQGSHALGERAKHLHLGILVVRFELPFKASCLSCQAIVDKGVRFNAEKRRVGAYFSTPVYSFSFSCPSCNRPFVITTDPKRARYLCTQGLKQRLGDEPDAASGNPRLLQPEERERLAANPVLEREEKLVSRRQRQLLLLQQEEQRLAEEETPQQQQLRECISSQRLAAAQLLLQQQQADDYAANRLMRQQLQQRKRAAAAAAAAAEEGVEVEADEASLRGVRRAGKGPHYSVHSIFPITVYGGGGKHTADDGGPQPGRGPPSSMGVPECKGPRVMRGAPFGKVEGALKQQQAKTLEGPLKAQLQQLGAPTDALEALASRRSQQDLYLLLLALIKKTCSSESWRAQLGEGGETREQLLLLLLLQLDSFAAALEVYRVQQREAAETVSPQLEETRKDSASNSRSCCSSSNSNSSSNCCNSNSSSNCSSSSSSSRVVELAGVLCVFIRLLRNLCVKPLFLEALLSKGLLSRIVSGAQVVETCSVASRLLYDHPAAAAAAAAAASQPTAVDEGTLSAAAAAAAEPATAAAAAAGLLPSFFSLPFMCAEALLIPQSLLQLLGNAAAAAAAPAAAAAGSPAGGASAGVEGGWEETRSQIWKAVGRLQLLELALCSTSSEASFAFLHFLFGCSDAAAAKLTEEPMLELQAALFTMAGQEAACLPLVETQGRRGAPPGVLQGDCGEWVCIFCCSLLTRLRGLQFVALLEFIQQRMTVDVLELFSLALLSPSSTNGDRQKQGPRSPSELTRFSFLLQRLQHKFGAACRGSLVLFLLGLADALLQAECSKEGAPSKLLQSVGTSVSLLRFLRGQLEAAIRGIHHLQDARRLYFSVAAAPAAAAAAAEETEGFLLFVCAASRLQREIAAAARAGEQQQQQRQQQQQDEQQQDEQTHQQDHFDLLLFSLPQPLAHSTLEALVQQSASIAKACAQNSSSSSSSSGRVGCMPAWLTVSDSLELVGGLLSHVAEAAQRCSMDHGGEAAERGGAQGSAAKDNKGFSKEASALVNTLVLLLRLYQQQRVVAALVAQEASGSEAAGRIQQGGPTEGGPPRGGGPDGTSKPQRGDGGLWQLIRWSLNATVLLKALANLCASCEAAKQTALEADAAPLLLAFTGIEETSPFAREAATLALKVLTMRSLERDTRRDSTL